MKTLIVLSILVVSLVIAKPSEAIGVEDVLKNSRGQGDIVDIEYDSYGVHLTYSPATGFSVECTAYTSKGVAIAGGLGMVVGKVARVPIMLPRKYRTSGTRLRFKCE